MWEESEYDKNYSPERNGLTELIRSVTWVWFCSLAWFFQWYLFVKTETFKKLWKDSQRQSTNPMNLKKGKSIRIC